MTPSEALIYLSALLDDTLDHNDPVDAKRIEAVELAIEIVKKEDVRSKAAR
ncbi:MAG TPA: hypothetical protein VGV60_06720 [Candidatus Polarisedimenticolia bacterium]|jgi:hypothetical protein|nr:hypothetical protein [Candidatus Polarisedimenticolia bacterium]